MCLPTTLIVFWRYWKYKLPLHFICLLGTLCAYSQVPEDSILLETQEKAILIEDSTFLNSEDEVTFFEEISDLDPNKAAIYSALLPGLGQAYNRQYWKIPIIYGAFIGIFHGIRYNHELFNDFTNALRAEQDGDPNTINGFGDNISANLLSRNRDKVRRDRDFLIIIGVVAYLVNIVEAHVAAHLHEFQINDKLSMEWNPKIQSTPLVSRSPGLSLTFNLK